MYYMLELAFYWSLCFSQFFDVKRKDFWEMFLHHAATISLIMFSWTTHFVRMGTLVMIVHDCSDPLLELAKLLRYANHNKVSEAVLVVFTPIWVISRSDPNNIILELHFIIQVCCLPWMDSSINNF